MYVIFKGLNKVVLLCGFIFGVGLAIIFFKTEEDFAKRHTGIITLIRTTLYTHNFYLDFLTAKNLKRNELDNDEVSYGDFNSSILREDKLLYSHVHVTCVIFVKNLKKARAVQKTYGNIKHCNRVLFFGLQEDKSVPIVTLKSKSTWHHVCQSIIYMWELHQDKLEWVLVTNDELFAIPENLRYYIAHKGYNYNDTYYLGNPLSFWGQQYNSGKSGYVLSRGTLVAFSSLFNSTDEKNGRSCSTGFNWRNEDFYLGKYLAEIGITVSDTRDPLGRSRFHGYGLNRLMVKGSISVLDTYRRNSVYKMKDGPGCCSNETITFRASDPGEMYFFSYIMYKVRVFRHGGTLGNQPYPVAKEDEWMALLEHLNLRNVSLESEAYDGETVGTPTSDEEFDSAL